MSERLGVWDGKIEWLGGCVVGRVCGWEGEWLGGCVVGRVVGRVSGCAVVWLGGRVWLGG